MGFGEQSQSSRATHAMALVERHQPWEILEDTALAIIDQTYAAALDVVGRRGLKDGVVELRAAVCVAGPDSPVLTVHASATHCCVALNNPRGDALPYREYTSQKQKMWPRHLLGRACISVSPGTLFLSRTDDGGRWSSRSSPDVWPGEGAAGGRGALAILDAIVLRLGAAIRLEEALLVKAMASGCCMMGPKADEILTVRNALDEMRSEMDLPALMDRIRHKRRGHDVAETTCRPEQNQSDEAERLAKKLRGDCLSL